MQVRNPNLTRSDGTLIPHVCGVCMRIGGIGPLTIAAVLPAVLAAAAGAAHPVWIDMESSLRTLCCSTSSGVQRDEFSLSACMACIAVAREHGLPRTVII